MSNKYTLEVISADNGYFIEIYNDYQKMRTLISNTSDLKMWLNRSLEELIGYIEKEDMTDEL